MTDIFVVLHLPVLGYPLPPEGHLCTWPAPRELLNHDSEIDVRVIDCFVREHPGGFSAWGTVMLIDQGLIHLQIIRKLPQHTWISSAGYTMDRNVFLDQQQGVQLIDEFCKVHRLKYVVPS